MKATGAKATPGYTTACEVESLPFGGEGDSSRREEGEERQRGVAGGAGEFLHSAPAMRSPRIPRNEATGFVP